MGEFDPNFTEALVTALAIDLAYDLSAGRGRNSDLKAEFKENIKDAQIANAIEGTPEIFEASEWTTARLHDEAPREGPVI